MFSIVDWFGANVEEAPIAHIVHETRRGTNVRSNCCFRIVVVVIVVIVVVVSAAMSFQL